MMNKGKFGILKAVLLSLVILVTTVAVFAQREEYEIPRLYFEGDISEMHKKSDVRNIRVEYIDGDTRFEGYAALKVQGSSSLNYVKKNYTINFYADEAHEEKMPVDMGWGPQSKYCLKANWIDKTHARNIVTANLVTEVQEKYGIMDEAPANGAIDGFPIEVYSNGKFHGLYTCNIPKDAWQFAMDEDNPDHIVICSEGYADTNLFYEMPNFDDWSVEVGEESEETMEKMNRLFDFVMNSTDEEFRENAHQYLDLDAAFNYYAVVRFANLVDNRAKNMLLATYDGQIWYMSLYDLDTSWGTESDGRSEYDYKRKSISLSHVTLHKRLEDNFPAELSQRYFELREDILTKEHVLELFEEFRAQIPDIVFEKELRRWGVGIPGYDYSQIDRYMDTVMDRLDMEFAQMAGK